MRLSAFALIIIILCGFICAGFVGYGFYQQDYSYKNLGGPIYEFSDSIAGVFNFFGELSDQFKQTFSKDRLHYSERDINLFTYSYSDPNNVTGTLYLLVYGDSNLTLDDYYSNDSVFSSIVAFSYDGPSDQEFIHHLNTSYRFIRGNNFTTLNLYTVNVLTFNENWDIGSWLVHSPWNMNHNGWQYSFVTYQHFDYKYYSDYNFILVKLG